MFHLEICCFFFQVIFEYPNFIFHDYFVQKYGNFFNALHMSSSQADTCLCFWLSCKTFGISLEQIFWSDNVMRCNLMLTPFHLQPCAHLTNGLNLYFIHMFLLVLDVDSWPAWSSSCTLFRLSLKSWSHLNTAVCGMLSTLNIESCPIYSGQHKIWWHAVFLSFLTFSAWTESPKKDPLKTSSNLNEHLQATGA